MYFLNSLTPVRSPLSPQSISRCLIIMAFLSAGEGAGSRGLPLYAQSRSLNIHGFPIAPRPIITMSQPVSESMLMPSSAVVTSPLAITGTDTLSFTFLIMSLSTVPL